MLTVYLNQNDIPNDHEYIDKNDYFFEFNTNITELDNLDCAKELIKKIDQSDYLGGGKIISKFTNKLVENIEYHSIEHLSSGCKTLLNILLHPEIVFNTIECGYNVIDEIIKLDKGKIYIYAITSNIRYRKTYTFY